MPNVHQPPAALTRIVQAIEGELVAGLRADQAAGHYTEIDAGRFRWADPIGRHSIAAIIKRRHPVLAPELVDELR